tara:strand:- start:809 stop:2206 length:1398 start_codon:yes stop_codon:yes gene_type:complete
MNTILNDRNNNLNSISSNINECLTIHIIKKLCPIYENDISDPFIMNIFFPTNKKKFTIESFFFSSFYYKNKFLSLKEMMDNIFIKDDQKEYMKSIFFKMQFVLKNLNLFSRNIIYKKKYRMRFHENQEDLKLIPFKQYDQRFIIQIIENNTIYKFLIFDLLEIINTSLTYSYALFAEPKYPRNPYTNIALSSANLYNIFFFAKKLDIKLDLLFHGFYKCDFNIETFLIDYECLIRDEIIENYYKNASTHKQYKDCIELWNKYKKIFKPIVIHKDFPKKKVIKELFPFIKMELFVNYSYNPSKSLYYKNLLLKSLKKFSRENPGFGRIILKPNFKEKFISNVQTQNIVIRNRNFSHNENYDYFENVTDDNSNPSNEPLIDEPHDTDDTDNDSNHNRNHNRNNNRNHNRNENGESETETESETEIETEIEQNSFYNSNTPQHIPDIEPATYINDDSLTEDNIVVETE